MNAAYKYDIIDFEDDSEIYQEDNEMLKPICSISLSDLMSEDHDPWIHVNSKFGFDLEIDNENAETIAKEQGIHPYAIASMARFCRRFLSAYAHYCDE